MNCFPFSSNIPMHHSRSVSMEIRCVPAPWFSKTQRCSRFSAKHLSLNFIDGTLVCFERSKDKTCSNDVFTNHESCSCCFEPAWFELGNRGRFAEALAAFDKALELEPSFALARNNQGWTLGV